MEAEGSKGVDYSIVVEEMMTDLNKISRPENLAYPHSSIFRIPEVISSYDKRAYTPDAFSIGPFHFGKPQLKETQKIKSKYLFGLISRSRAFVDPSEVLLGLTRAICDIQREALEYYATPVGMEADEFVKVLVLDGCFILELFRKKAYQKLVEQDDPIFATPRIFQFLYHDLILLENQIPLMVLQILFDMTVTWVDEKPLVQLAIEFFGTTFSIAPMMQRNIGDLVDRHESKHILDLLRNSLVLSSTVITNRPRSGWDPEPMRSATNLRDFGIKFKTVPEGSLLNVRFSEKEGVFEIPQLRIHESTHALFRNLICLEMYCRDYEGVITSYALLFDNLIQTSTDIKILCESGIVSTTLPHDDAAKILSLSDGLDYSYVRENWFASLVEDVNSYCESRRRSCYRRVMDYYRRRWPQYKTELKQVYFSHPWAVISTIAASLLLIMTFLQTLFTILYK